MPSTFTIIGIFLFQIFSTAQAANPFLADYKLGTKNRYLMTGVNQSDTTLKTYSVILSTLTKEKENGIKFDEIGFSEFTLNGEKVSLDKASLEFRQAVSVDLSFDFQKHYPDQSKIHPELAAPSDDIFNIFVDLQVGARLETLQKTGDHLYMPYGVNTVYLNGEAQTCVDFDVSVQEVNYEIGLAALRVQHVPPKNQCINVPAPWMNDPVKQSLPNNVTRIRPLHNGTFELIVGSETIDVLVKVKIGTAQIVEAQLTDTFDLISRICSDQEGKTCEAPKYYQQKRTITVVPI